MDLNIELSKDGYKILKIEKDNKSIYMGSKYNQKREIDKFINNFNEFTEKDNLIVLGLSFGEHIKELLQLTCANNKILIVEFNKTLIEYCKKDKEINKILNNSQVIISSNENEVEDFVVKYININNVEKLRVINYCSYNKIYEQEIDNTYDLIRNKIIEIKLYRNTVLGFGTMFFNNLISNLKYIGKATAVNKLKNVYKNKPAIIVSAGPSLIKNIDHLKEVDNALILSGGRTLGALIDRNISPSCLGIVDPGEVSYKLVKDYIEDIECPLLFKDMTNFKVVKNHRQKKIFYAENKFITDVFDVNIKSLYGGGSIAHTLTLFALHMGCNPIIFIGQDLAYTGEQGHATCSLNKWDKWTFDKYKMESDIYIEDINGETIRTSLLLNNYRESLENIIKEHDGVGFINATEGGANIKGTKVKLLKEVLRNLKKEKITSLNGYLKNEDRTEIMAKALRKTLGKLNEYIQVCEDGLDALDKYKLSYDSKNENNTNKAITKINNINIKLSKYEDELSIISDKIIKLLYEVENKEEFIINSKDEKNLVFNKKSSKLKAYYLGLIDVINDCYKKIKAELKYME